MVCIELLVFSALFCLILLTIHITRITSEMYCHQVSMLSQAFRTLRRVWVWAARILEGSVGILSKLGLLFSFVPKNGDDLQVLIDLHAATLAFLWSLFGMQYARIKLDSRGIHVTALVTNKMVLKCFLGEHGLNQTMYMMYIQTCWNQLQPATSCIVKVKPDEETRPDVDSREGDSSERMMVFYDMYLYTFYQMFLYI